MVHAVHQQQVGGEGHILEELRCPVQQAHGGVQVGGKALGVVVPVFHVDGQGLRSIGATPDEFAFGGLAGAIGVKKGVAPAKDHAVNAKAPQNLGQLGDVAKLVRQVAHRAGLAAELPAQAGTLQKVAHRGLAAGKVQVVLQIPGADDQAALLNVLFQLGTPARAHRQVVLQNHGLGVQMKNEFRIFLHGFQAAVNQVHQLHAKLLKGQVPLPVPVGVGDNAIDFHRKFSCVRFF